MLTRLKKHIIPFKKIEIFAVVFLDGNEFHVYLYNFEA